MPRDIAIKRFLLVAAAFPALTTVIGVTIQLLSLSSVPNPAAIHWSGTGAPDGFAPPWLTVLLTAVLGLGIPAGLVAGTLPSLRQGDRGSTYRALAAGMASTTWLIVVLLTWTTVMQRGLTDAHDAPGIGWPLLASLATAALVGAAGWFAQPHSDTVHAAASPVEALQLAPDERAVWIRNTTLAPPIVALIIALTIACGGGAIGTWMGATSRGAAIALTVVFVMLLLTAVTLTGFRVRVDRTGLGVRSLVGFPRFHVPLADIADVSTTDVRPLGDFGGYGVRWLPKHLGIVLRSGAAVDVLRSSGKRFVVTVDDADTAVALLGGLVAQRHSAPSGTTSGESTTLSLASPEVG